MFSTFEKIRFISLACIFAETNNKNLKTVGQEIQRLSSFQMLFPFNATVLLLSLSTKVAVKVPNFT